MFSFKIKAKGQFISQLQQRLNAWQGVETVSILLRVPYAHRWWYWQEFGTASGIALNPEEVFPEGIEQNTTPTTQWPNGYGIVSRKPGGVLAYETRDGELRFAHAVHHPGIKPRRPVRAVLEEIRNNSTRFLHIALRQGGAKNPQVFTAVIKFIGPDAKRLIVESFGRKLRGMRTLNMEHARLHGKSAAEVLQQEITVETRSDK